MRGKGKSGATTAAKENAVNTVAKKAESTIEAVAEKAKEAVKKVEVKEEAVKETLAETKAEVKAEVKAAEKAVEKAAEPATAVTAAEAAPAKKTAARKTAAKKTETKPAEKKAAAVRITPQRTLLQYIFNLCLGSRINGHFKSCFHKVSDHRFSHNADTDKSDFFHVYAPFDPDILLDPCFILKLLCRKFINRNSIFRQINQYGMGISVAVPFIHSQLLCLYLFVAAQHQTILAVCRNTDTKLFSCHRRKV